MQWPKEGLVLEADGATNPKEGRWGVGIYVPQKKLEVYMGGSMNAITLPDDPPFVQKRLSVEVAEVAALWCAVRYALKLIENREPSASKDKCNITLVIDRPASMVSLQHAMLNCCKAYKCEEFKAILLHLSNSFPKLCKAAGGEVIVRWKGDVEHLQYLQPKEWQPDTLARLGSTEGRNSLPLEWYPVCDAIAIQLTCHPHNKSLMTKAIVSLRPPTKIHAPGRVTHGHPLHLGHEEAIAAAGLPDDGGTGISREAKMGTGYIQHSELTVEDVMP